MSDECEPSSFLRLTQTIARRVDPALSRSGIEGRSCHEINPEKKQAFQADIGSDIIERSDEDLLKLILSYIMPQAKVPYVVEVLLLKFTTFEGVISAPAIRLAEVPELELDTAEALKLIHSALLKFQKNLLRRVSVVENWDALLRYLRIQLAYEDYEQIKLFLLDGTYRLLGEHNHSVGGISSVHFCPIDIIKRAKDAMAPFIIVAHNHPSGNAKPTRQDKVATSALAREASAAGIKLLDQLIVGRNGLMSFRQEGFLS